MQSPERSTSVTSRNSGASGTSIYFKGAVAGLLAAALLALWFFYLDYGRGRVLYTPTVLGTILFRGADAIDSVETIQGNLELTILFTLVHGLVFVVMGLAAAHLLRIMQRGPNLLVAILVLFVIIQMGFIAFALTFSAVAMHALNWPDVIFGNLIAATLLVSYLWRHRPR